MSKPQLNIPILVVDDDAQVREIVVEYLKSFGFTRITHAKDSSQALKIVQDSKVPIELILSDWEMPEVNGLTLLKAVRKHPTRSQTKFIMVTSQRSMERFKITQAAQWNVDAYIVKPFRRHTLKDKIWDVMGWSEETKKTGT